MTDSPEQALVVFTPSGKRGSFPIGTSVLDAARNLGVDLDSICGGRGLCGRCQVLCSEGEFSKHNIVSHLEHLGESTKVEARYQRINGDFATGRRLGCQATVQGDLVIDVPPDSQVHKQVIRKALDHANMTVNPALRLYVVDVQEPDMHDPSGDLRRLKQALETEWGLKNLTANLVILKSLQPILRKGEWQVTVAVHDASQDDNPVNPEIVGVWPGFKESIYGLAIDVGSTTIAGHLCDS